MVERLRSKEELYVYWYLEELRKAGYIESITYEEVVFELGESFEMKRVERLKTKTKESTVELVSKRQYKIDFCVKWDLSAHDIFFRTLDENFNPDIPFIANAVDYEFYSLLEVKGNFDLRGKTYQARLKCDWVWHQYKKYVQVVWPVPNSKKDEEGNRKILKKEALFLKSFTPLRYFFNDNDGNRRVIHYKTKTLQEFLNSRTSKFI